MIWSECLLIPSSFPICLHPPLVLQKYTVWGENWFFSFCLVQSSLVHNFSAVWFSLCWSLLHHLLSQASPLSSRLPAAAHDSASDGHAYLSATCISDHPFIAMTLATCLKSEVEAEGVLRGWKKVRKIRGYGSCREKWGLVPPLQYNLHCCQIMKWGVMGSLCAVNMKM